MDAEALQTHSTPMQWSQLVKWRNSALANETGSGFREYSRNCGIGIWMPSGADINALYH
jgi:hypothetical protein